MKKYVVGDLHGGFKAFKDTLEKANFDYEKDLLICLGDICDGWSETKEIIDELLKMKNLVYLLGNHDEWALEYYNGDTKDDIGVPQVLGTWYYQGGDGTIKSLGEYAYQDKKYVEFLKTGKMFYEINSNHEDGTITRQIFAHGNIPAKMFNMEKLIEQNNTEPFIWDRYLISEAARKRNSWKTVDDRFDEILFGT